MVVGSGKRVYLSKVGVFSGRTPHGIVAVKCPLLRLRVSSKTGAGFSGSTSLCLSPKLGFLRPRSVSAHSDDNDTITFSTTKDTTRRCDSETLPREDSQP